MILEIKKWYHGSYIEIEKPEISKCMPGKDFGRGFYVTTDRKQAERFVKSSIGKAVKNGMIKTTKSNGFINVYEYIDLNDLQCYEFESADIEWLHCVAAHRRSGLFPEETAKWEKYDIIAGKIANDTTNQVITAYINGIYGVVGSAMADRVAIELLMPNKLTDQICIRTEKALKYLQYKGAVEYHLR